MLKFDICDAYLSQQDADELKISSGKSSSSFWMFITELERQYFPGSGTCGDIRVSTTL